MIDLRWFGHSFWRFSGPETSIVTDPFDDIGYPMPTDLHADIILCSHDHHDHNNIGLVVNKPRCFREPGQYEYHGVTIDLRAEAHDDAGGSKRGKTLLMKFTIEGRTFLHCGDLGYIPDDDVLAWMGKVDGLFIPVSGTYTIDAKQAWAIVEHTQPTLVFPQHYLTPTIAKWSFARIDDFLRLVRYRRIDYIEGNTMTLSEQSYAEPRVIVFSEYA
jgi:L-ascorbate metabolism protein UlaG (beta-lactamase superfamily)